MKENWRIHRGKYQEMARILKVDPVLAIVISNRTTPEEAMDYINREGPLGDPNEINDVPEAVDCLLRHRETGDKVRIIGDYDVDGVTSASILYLGLTGAGIETSVRIPDRQKDGYGTRPYMVDEAIGDGCSLIVTCDNGIREFETFDYAREKGIEVILTDHHEITKDADGQDEYPDVDYVINPHRQDCTYPEKGLCGAGVAYKLMQALYGRLGLKLPDRLLGLAALGTVCDLMELSGENRRIVWQGLKIWNRAYQTGSGDLPIGVRVLMREAGIDRLDVYRMGFIIGPMINAGGRLLSQQKYIRIFLTDDQQEASQLAGELRMLNAKRQAMTEAGVKEACGMLAAGNDQNLIKVLHLPDTHESLAGLIAGRLKEKYGCPCFVFTGTGEILKGSGRSVEAYDMFSRLQAQEKLLERYGGHKMAAGLSIRRENLDDFRQAVNLDCGLGPDDLLRTVWIDAQLKLSDVSLSLAERLLALEPFGNGNEEPLFAEKGVKLHQLRLMGREKNVGRLFVSDQGQMAEMICFQMDRLAETVTEKAGQEAWDSLSCGEKLQSPVTLDIVYTVGINEYHGNRSVQCQLKHVR